MTGKRQPVFTKKTLREQLAEILRTQILRAEIAPGERITEEEISKKYQVSRGPVREALRQLEEEGLISYVPYKGCLVKMLTHEEMSELYLIRSTLEGLAVRIYSGKMSQEGMNKLQQSIDDLQKAAKEKDLYEIVDADERFHSAIVEEAGCKKLFRLWKSLVGANTSTYYTMKNQGLMPYDVLGTNHQRMLELFKDRVDVETIVKAIADHYMVVPETLYNATQLEAEKEKINILA